MLGEHQITVARLEREALAQILERDLGREALESLALRSARPARRTRPPVSRPPPAGRPRWAGCTCAWSQADGARQLRDHDQVMPASDHPRQARMPQRVRGQHKSGVAAKLAHHRIGRPRRQATAPGRDEQGPLVRGGERRALRKPLVQDLAGERVQRHLAILVALARANHQHTLARRHPHVIDIERDQLRQPRGREQRRQHDRPIPRRRALGRAQQPALVLPLNARGAACGNSSRRTFDARAPGSGTASQARPSPS